MNKLTNFVSDPGLYCPSVAPAACESAAAFVWLAIVGAVALAVALAGGSL